MKTGNLKKLYTKFQSDGTVEYYLIVGEEQIPLNEFVGKKIKLSWTGEIHCVACGRKTKKSFAQGHCFPCMRDLASCDMCMMKPEICHYHEGTCRQPDWGEEHCLRPHYVYLANSSGLKVGITRTDPPVSRWIDQGAVAGKAWVQVDTRKQAGLVEVAIKKFISDKTNWRTMLKGNNAEVDLSHQCRELERHLPDDVPLKILDEPVVQIKYPVEKYPEKIKSFNFDKDPLVEGILNGIKGQYLIFENGVINIRKFTGYKVSFE